DDRFMFNMFINNRHQGLLSRDFTTNPIFGGVELGFENKKELFASKFKLLNSAYGTKLVDVKGNTKGTRYKLAEDIRIDIKTDVNALREYARQRAFDFVMGQETEFPEVPQVVMREVRKTLSGLVGRKDLPVDWKDRFEIVQKVLNPNF